MARLARAAAARHVMRDMHTFEHPTCFVPGMLALGAHHQAKERHMGMGSKAGAGPHMLSILYERQPARLGPERVAFGYGRGGTRAAEEERRMATVGRPKTTTCTTTRWPLRPEYVESLYIMRTHSTHWSGRSASMAEMMETTEPKPVPKPVVLSLGDGTGDDGKGGDGDGGEGVKEAPG